MTTPDVTPAHRPDSAESGGARGRRRPIDPRLWRYSASVRGYLVLSVVAALIDVAAIVVSVGASQLGAARPFIYFQF